MNTTVWHLITLDANNLLCNIPKRNIVKKNGNFTVSFKYDLSDKNNILDRDIILKEDAFADNALLFQLNKLVPKTSEKENALRTSIVFVDFSELFREKDNLSEAKPLGDNLSEAELLSKEAWLYRLNLLFKDGLFLNFDGKNFRKFVPFDKSNSMARNCQITFIDEKIKDALEQRLMLDMNFVGEEMVLSKFYAYRGLYLSSAFRIDAAKNFPLNEETVVVLPDQQGSLPETKVFTATRDSDGEFWKYKIEKTPLSVNLFDGEGLIAPDFAEYISDFLQKVCGFSEPSHSFQIRMPFTKGVLHEVDFKKFFEEHLPQEVDFLLVKDIFGITRDLYKAKIILTESMFKCASWCKSLAEKMKSFAEDPMKFFFDKFAKYEHALYVTNTEARLSNPGRVSLNYQFLSTLALTEGEFDSLVDDQCKKIIAFRENPAANLRYLPENEETDDETNNETDNDESNFRPSDIRTACLRVAEKNPAFRKDPKYKNIIATKLKNYACNLGLGRLEVEGEQRFLSCDLLALLVRILGLVKNVRVNPAMKKFLKEQYLDSNQFFMPKNKIRLDNDGQYAFLRNPHLSRNEQVLLNACVNSKSLYHRFFSHLKGVVMISCKSTAAMSLGGADFDGDLVKVVSDSRIVQAVKRGNGDLKLPIVKIPAAKAIPKKLRHSIPLSVIIDTFANKVGRVSDWAVTLSEKEYSAENVEDAYKNVCAKCTLTVGLEIDAAKTGIHPEANIQELQSLKKSCGESLFLKAKKEIRKILRWSYSPSVDIKDGVFLLHLSKNAKADLTIPVEPKSAAFIEKLPARYLQFLHEQAASEKKKDKVSEPAPYFDFEVSGWRKSLDKTKCEEIVMLTTAYLRVLSLAGKMQRRREFALKTNFDGHVLNVLRLQYDELTQKLPCGIEVEKALTLLFGELAEMFESLESVRLALQALKTQKWHLTCEKDRPKVAAEILKTKVDSLPASFELLYNFRCNGYMLFYYVLKDLELRFYEDADFVSETEEAKVAEELGENKYYTKLHQVYSESVTAKETKSVWNPNLVKICRDTLGEIFKDDMSEALKYLSEALKYFWSQKSKDPGRNFFWNIFTVDEILKSVSKEGASSC